MRAQSNASSRGSCIRNFSGTAKRSTKPFQPSCLALKRPLFQADGGASDQSENVGADCPITGFFGKKPAQQNSAGNSFCFSLVWLPDRGSMKPTGARSGVPQIMDSCRMPNHLGTGPAHRRNRDSKRSLGTKPIEVQHLIWPGWIEL